MTKFRRTMVLREVEIEMVDLKKGDIFRMIPADNTDIHAEPNQYVVAVNDAYLEKNIEGNVGVDTEKIDFVITQRIKIKSVDQP